MEVRRRFARAVAGSFCVVASCLVACSQSAPNARLATTDASKNAGNSGPSSDGATTAPSARMPSLLAPPLEEACVPTGPERCLDARDDNCNGLIDEGCGLPMGLVNVLVAWERDDAEVRLEVADPTGAFADPHHGTEGGLVKLHECGAGCAAPRYEHVIAGEDALPGRYQVAVRVGKLGSGAEPLRVRVAAQLGLRSYATELRFDAPDSIRRFSLRY